MTHHHEASRRLRSAFLVLLVLVLSLVLSACTRQGDVTVSGDDVVIDTGDRNDNQDDNKPDKGDTRPDHGASEDDSISGKDPTVLPDLPIGEN